jgi:lipoteichoic acid synthase
VRNATIAGHLDRFCRSEDRRPVMIATDASSNIFPSVPLTEPPADEPVADESSAWSRIVAFGPVLWAWLAAVALTAAVHYTVGLRWPDWALAGSAAALPAAAVAVGPRRGRRWWALATICVLAAVALADALHLRYFGVVVPMELVGHARWPSATSGADVLGMLQLSDAWVLAVVVLSIGFARKWPGVAPPPPHRRWTALIPVLLCLFAAAPALVAAVLADGSRARPESGGFLHAHLRDVRRGVVQRWLRSPLSASDRAAVERFVAHRSNERGAPNPWRGRARGASVLLVQVAGLRTWVLDLDVAGQPVMPFLRQLARGGLYVPNLFDQTADGAIADGGYAALASQHPLAEGLVFLVHPTSRVAALPEVVKQRGYATLSAVDYDGPGWAVGRRHALYGFEQTLFASPMPSSGKGGRNLGDAAVFGQVGPELARTRAPFLAWISASSMSGPHRRTGPGASRPGLPLGTPLAAIDSLGGTALGAYLDKAHQFDRALREFVSSLDPKQRRATVIAVYGAAGQPTGFDAASVRELAGLGASPPAAADLLLDRVPLILSGPGLDKGQTVATVGGQIDIAPTILAVLGMDGPRSFLGRSLLPARSGQVARASGAAASSARLWTGQRCFSFPTPAPRPASECWELNRQARQELRVSWQITGHDLAGELDAGAVAGGPR